MGRSHDKDGNKKLSRLIKEKHQYKMWKRRVIERDGKCMKCGTTEDLTAHHIIPVSELVERHNIKTSKDATECKELWDVSLGVCYCEEHHRNIHNQPKKRGWKLIRHGGDDR